MKNIKGILVTLVCGLMLFSAQTASADLFGFYNITNNNSTDAATGEAQLFVEITAKGSSVSFLFSNTGPNDSSITDIYFDDDSSLLSAPFTINNHTGVDFSAGASPGDLPGGNNVSPVFSATSGLTADSNPPAQPNGVNPGELLEIVFAANANDVLAAINGSTLRIGIHVQGFSGGGSESFINRPNPVPEPTTMLLLGLGLIGLAGVGRRKFIK